MKNIYLLLLFILGGFNSSAQVFFTESFEAAVGTSGSGGDCSCVAASVDAIDGQNDHFGRANGNVAALQINHNSHISTDNYTGYDGTFIWASEDNDDPQVGGSGNSTLCISMTTSIAGRSDLFLSGLFGANNAAIAYEATDFMQVFYSIDGGGLVEVMDFREDVNQQLSLDINSDDVGDAGIVLSSAMQNVGVSIPVTGNSITIEICTNSNTSNEEYAFDQIQLAEVALPVTLLHFNAELQDKDVVLDWETASEINNDYFVVERSINGIAFESIGRLEGYGTTNLSQSYSFIDKNIPTISKVYYRLAQYDFDGTMEYSDINVVQLDRAFHEIRIFPNPIRGQGKIILTTTIPEKKEVTIYNLTGRLIRQKQVSEEENNIPIEVSKLPPGSYLIKLQSDHESQVLHFLKMD